MANKIENKMLNEELVEIAIGDLYLYDEATGLEYATTTLTSAEFSSSADKTDVRGGTDNAVLYSIPGEKEMTFTVTDVVNRTDITALKNASSVEEVDTKDLYSYHMPKFYDTTIASNKVTFELDKTPIKGEQVMMYTLQGNLIEESLVTINDKQVEIDNTTLGLTEGAKVRVMGFKYKVDASAMYYTISAEGVTVNLVGVYKKPIYNRKTMKVEYYKTTYYPQVTLDSNYSESDSSTREAIEETHTFTITKKDGEQFAGYVYYERA